jgi:hypothetical protein
MNIERIVEIDDLPEIMRSNLKTIENDLISRTGVEVDFSTAVQSITRINTEFKESFIAKANSFSQVGGDLFYIDSDNDQVSDYEEVNIYHTDPATEDASHAEKILQGLNPTSSESESIVFEDVTAPGTTTPLFKIEKIDVLEEKVLQLSGLALPNSFVTLYIFSTPIIVTVKSDEQGVWTYTMDKELENGEHTAYVAKVDNSGKILSKSTPTLFVKSAEAATILPTPLESVGTKKDIVKDNLILIVIMIFCILCVFALLLVGNDKKDTAI